MERTRVGDVEGAVVLTLPADERFASIARGLAVSCASLDSFDVDDLVDVRLVVDEVFNALAVLGHGTVTLALSLRPGALGLVASAPSAGRSTWASPELAPTRRIIGVLCTAAAFGVADATVWFEGELRPLPRSTSS